jgi:hypothetical protein
LSQIFGKVMNNKKIEMSKYGWKLNDFFQHFGH